MRRGILVILPLAVAAACGELVHRQSNAFPCDFFQPPGERDAVCPPGDVCGVDHRCQRYVYEGPRFEGVPTLPRFGAEVDGGTVLHPLRLRSGPVLLSRLPSALGVAVVDEGANTHLFTLDRGVLSGPVLPDDPAFRKPRQLVVMNALGTAWSLLVVTPAGGLYRAQPALLRPGSWDVDPILSSGVERLRLDWNTTGVPGSDAARIQLLVQPRDGARPGRIAATGLPRDAFSAFDAGAPDEVLDVAFVSRPDLASPLLVSRAGLWLSLDGGFRLASPEAADFGASATIRADPRDALFAVLHRVDAPGRAQRVSALSTWQLNREGSGWAFRRAWSDCSVCGDDSAALATPTFTTGVGTVEVLCLGVARGRVVRVLDSATTAPQQPCTQQALVAPFDLRRLATRLEGLERRPVMDESFAGGVVLGGTGGELWIGETLSGMLPAFLDRVPEDVMLGETLNGHQTVLVLTDRFVAVSGEGAESNGFRRLLFGDGQSPTLPQDRPLAFIHGGGGWMVLATGELARLRTSSSDGGGYGHRLDFGPRLTDGRGHPITQALFGEAVSGLDGGLVSAVVVADDSLYLAPLASASAELQASVEDQTPQVTPEPGTRIRSFALERTPIGTNGVDKVRGYLVTSHNLHAFQLSGTPPRWATAPLVLAGGEPLEVWMDNPRGGLARVGYRDGRVFSLPGGFQLVEALPALDASEPPQVLDYENLGGWPVAYASTGLYVAGWDVAAGGLPENRFPDGGVNRPMTWRPVALPDGSRPWMEQPQFGPSPGSGAWPRARSGRLFVAMEPQESDPSTGVFHQVFRLLLFLDDQVLEVGRHVRTNRSARLE